MFGLVWYLDNIIKSLNSFNENVYIRTIGIQHENKKKSLTSSTPTICTKRQKMFTYEFDHWEYNCYWLVLCSWLSTWQVTPDMCSHMISIFDPTCCLFTYWTLVEYHGGMNVRKRPTGRHVYFTGSEMASNTKCLNHMFTCHARIWWATATTIVVPDLEKDKPQASF